MDWDQAILATTLLAIDPNRLGGMVVRARVGPVRDSYLENLAFLPEQAVKVHPSMDEDALFGGLDLTSTLSTGTLVERAGLISADKTSVLTMAERCDVSLGARLAIALDDGTLLGLIALDEGAEDDEQVPECLSERLAFRVSLDFGAVEVGLLMDEQAVQLARSRLDSITAPEIAIETIVSLCFQLGIDSCRAPAFALSAARAHAALRGSATITDVDIELAAALCLAHRATRMPPPPREEEELRDQSADQEHQGDETKEEEIHQLEDRILEAVLAVLPEGVLDQLKPKGAIGRGSGAGSKHRGNRRGRPKPARAGRLSGQNRLDLIATLRAAAPWQRLRGAEPGRVKVTPSDFRIKQYEEKSDRLLIFAVDASGSAAIARLGEAKGAVELLLADAYSRRDHVCLVSFRGTEAETLLPPTRSLVQTKKRLAALPGGGGTPLAAGLIEALTLSHQARGHGMSPCIVLLTDGRANISLDGTADRALAAEDAKRMAQQVREAGTDTIVLDLGKRPSQFLSELAGDMNGIYMPLPRADAHRMSDAVTSALGR